jgi:uridine kinase
MEKIVTIFCKNNNTYKEVPMGTSLIEVYKQMGIETKYQVVSARVNNKMEDLDFCLYKAKKIDFVDVSSSSGMRVYVRSLIMVFYKAIEELFPGTSLRIEHPISKGYFCKLTHPTKTFSPEDINLIKTNMREIIDLNIPFIREEKESKEVIEMFSKRGMKDKVILLETLGEPYSEFYRLGNVVDYYNGVLVPSTGYLYLFDLVPYFDGLLLRIPNREDPKRMEDFVPQKKMFDIFKEYIEWNAITGLNNVGDVNIFYKEHKESTANLIKISEAFHEKKVAQIADAIYKKKDKVRIVLISGPSSSGKTTLSKRLAIQLMVTGLKPVTMSLDNYFVDREQNPLDENGEYDYESLYALDLDLFNSQLKDLFEGKEIETPTFDFVQGKKKYLGDKMKIDDKTIIVMEGIHALNPELTQAIDDELKFKVYVSALTTISLDDHNWVPTTDTRLLRRIIRDFRYRGYSAQNTISRWGSVRRGEEKWIFPYQENADIMFNSALLFELSVLKKHAEPILTEVPQNCDEYTEAHRLLKFLRYLTPILDSEIPPTSLLREFLGGSSFRY